MNQHRIQRAVSLSLLVAVMFATLGSAPAAAAPRSETSSAGVFTFQSGQYYIVRRGDTLYGIARRFGTTVEAIMAANGLRSTTIYIGQRLFIPGPQRIQFQRGSTSATVPGTLAANEPDTYVVRALAGQTMTVQVVASRANLLLSIHGANGEVLKSSGAGSASWSGRLPATQDYFITIGAEGGVATSYSLQVTIPPLATPAPGSQPQRIQFQRGSTSATVPGTLATNELDTYVLKALAGQTMIVQVVASHANPLLSIHGANGEVLKSSGAGSASWSGRLPTTQDYFITIGAEGGVATSYSLQVTIPRVRSQ